MASTTFPLTTAEIARALACPPANVERYWPGIEAACREAGMTDASSVIAVLATIGTEVASFQPIDEYGDNAYFTRMYEHNAKVARDLGNTKPGDGARYHGRGFIQLTGRANYRAYGSALGVPLEAKPELALDPSISARVLARYFKDRRLDELARKRDWRGVRRGVNGGYNGWDRFSTLVSRLEQAVTAKRAPAKAQRPVPERERPAPEQAVTAKRAPAKAQRPVPERERPAPEQPVTAKRAPAKAQRPLPERERPAPEPDRPLLREGMRHPAVKQLKAAVGPWIQANVTDGQPHFDRTTAFGRGLGDAVEIFQRRNGLEPDRVVGRDTWAALERVGALKPAADVARTPTAARRRAAPSAGAKRRPPAKPRPGTPPPAA